MTEKNFFIYKLLKCRSIFKILVYFLRKNYPLCQICQSDHLLTVTNTKNQQNKPEFDSRYLLCLCNNTIIEKVIYYGSSSSTDQELLNLL